MPTTYTHDVFGKQVYKMLPEEMKRIIRRNGEVYRIGLHGPDILFYFLISKNPVSQHGVKMHGERARDFFERGMKIVRDTGDEKLLSYLLGFGCHYLLDSVCHPYVNQMAAQRIISHTLLEKEMDRQLMINTGKDPLLYRPSDCVIPRYANARVIHRAIPEISTVFIWSSLHMMKWITNAMICNDNEWKRKWIGGISSLAGRKAGRFVKDYFMKREMDAKDLPYVQEGLKLYEKALDKAAEELQELFMLSKAETYLSERWVLNYKGM